MCKRPIKSDSPNGRPAAGSPQRKAAKFARRRVPGSLAGQHRPANIYNGVLKPILGYGIRGAIWYQGESNAGRAYQYRDLFPLMIKSGGRNGAQGDFPFYWVQLADFMAEAEPGDSCLGRSCAKPRR